MAKVKTVTVRTSAELARALGLSRADAMEMELRRNLACKIIAAVKDSGMTHAQVAQIAQTSRSRVTAVLNHNINDVSTDLLLRILASMGYRAHISFTRLKRSA